MKDRGIIKWQPFDSCFSSQKIIKDVLNQKKKQIMPTLSNDQIEAIEEKIIDAYHLKEEIKIKYYYNGIICEEKGKIQYIFLHEKKICLNQKYIYLKQILNVY
jgi:hypothetical protein